MIILIIGLSLFSISLLSHIVIWRFFLPNNHRRGLLIIFLVFLILGLISIHFVDIHIGSIKIRTPLLMVEIIHIVLLYVGLTLAYIVTYSGLEVDSPSLVIVNIISENFKEGISLEHLYETLPDEMLVKPRVDDLLKDNMAIKVNDKYFTTHKGANMARLFNFYRKLLNVSARGG